MIRNIKLLVSGLAIAFTFNACSNSSLSVFNDDSLYEKGLDYTQVADVVNSFETKAIINATYLNSTNSDKWNNKFENFLIGIYITNDNSDEKDQFLNNKKYHLTMNNQDINKSEELKSTNILYNHIPIKNPHAKYYIVSFNKDGNKTLVLKYSNSIYGNAVLSFKAE